MENFTVEECLKKIKELKAVMGVCEDEKARFGTMLKLASDCMSEEERKEMNRKTYSFDYAIDFHKLIIGIWEDNLKQAYLNELKLIIGELQEIINI